MQLSPHFTLREFGCKDGTCVPEHLVPALTAHCANVLEVIRETAGAPLSIVSGYRTVAYNNKINGADGSWHLWDRKPVGKFATDLSAKGLTPTQLRGVILGLIESKKIPEGGVGLYAGFVHYDNRGTRARWNG